MAILEPRRLRKGKMSIMYEKICPFQKVGDLLPVQAKVLKVNFYGLGFPKGKKLFFSFKKVLGNLCRIGAVSRKRAKFTSESVNLHSRNS